MKHFLTLLVAFCALLATAGNLNAQLTYDESVDGDLSGVFSNPDFLVFGVGSNNVIGDIGNNGNGGAVNAAGAAVGTNDADYFTISIGPSLQLDSIFVNETTGGVSSFFAYTEGTAFGGVGNGDLDGFVLFNNGSGEILDDIATIPLGPGDYTFWIQETGNVAVDYDISFNVSAIPEPGTLGFLAAGLGLVFVRRRRR